MSGVSKRLGNNYERITAKKLSEWLTGEKGADVCWKDLSSGARATSRKKEGLETKRNADIVATDLRYQYFFDRFFVDSKSYKEINLVFNNPKNQASNQILKQWDKVNEDCPDSMYPFMPVMIRDRKTPELLFLDTRCTFNEVSCVTYTFTNRPGFKVYLLEEFFNNIDPKDFYESYS